MKCFVILVIIFSFQDTWAVRDNREILKCLGREEKKFHLVKETGPLYDLNQKLIAELIQIPDVEVSPEVFQDVCVREKHSESQRLLQVILNRGKDIFVIPPTITGMQKQVVVSMIDDFIEASKEIFLNYISAIQTFAPSPSCLKEEIPQLDAFFTDIKYLQEDVDIKDIFRGRDQTIFEHLRKYPEAYKRCRERLKKKPKSVSKAPPKKR